jgi:hypothetical protein
MQEYDIRESDNPKTVRLLKIHAELRKATEKLESISSEITYLKESKASSQK